MELRNRRHCVSSPIVFNGVVYVGSKDYNIYALNATTGTKVWSYATGNSVEFSPTISNAIVYVGSDDHNVYALSAETGTKVWSYKTGGMVNTPAVYNGIVYVGSGDQNVYALNCEYRHESVELYDRRFYELVVVRHCC